MNQPNSPRPAKRTVGMLVIYGAISMIIAATCLSVYMWLQTTVLQTCTIVGLIEQCVSHTASDDLYILSGIGFWLSLILALVFFIVALFVYAFKK